MLAIACCLSPSALSPRVLESRRTLYWQHVDRIFGNSGHAAEHARLREFANEHFEHENGAASQPTLAPGQKCAVPFPGLRAKPFWNVDEFPWVADVEHGANAIVDELEQFEHACKAQSSSDSNRP